MKVDEIKDLSVEELQAKTEELQQELFNLKFQLHTGHLRTHLVFLRCVKT